MGPLSPTVYSAGGLPELKGASVPPANRSRRVFIVLCPEFLKKAEIAETVMGKNTIEKHRSLLRKETRLSPLPRG
jgi:hypothetical protein